MSSKAEPKNLSVENLADAIEKSIFTVLKSFDSDDGLCSVQFIEKDEIKNREIKYVRGLVVGIDWEKRELCFISDTHLEDQEHLYAYMESVVSDPSILRDYGKHFRRELGGFKQRLR